MRDRELECHRLAQTIEVLFAKDRASSRRRGRSKIDWHEEYDPHAATELGNLIYNRIVKQ